MKAVAKVELKGMVRRQSRANWPGIKSKELSGLVFACDVRYRPAISAHGCLVAPAEQHIAATAPNVPSAHNLMVSDDRHQDFLETVLRMFVVHNRPHTRYEKSSGGMRAAVALLLILGLVLALTLAAVLAWNVYRAHFPELPFSAEEMR